VITLTTDFGLKDPYVAEMKGAIYRINPKATIVDVSHLVDKYSVRMGAFILASAVPYFPKGSVHVAVVDPGVGTERRAILIETKLSFLVGPDNGVLMLAAQTQGIKHICELSNQKYMLPHVSSTFHGRDIFAPAAAYLEKGVKPQEFGTEITDPVTPKFANVETKNGAFLGEVLHVDSFGNVVTNINPTEIKDAKTIKVALHHVTLELPYSKTYCELQPREPLALVGSHGFLELALNRGSFSEKYRVNPGDRFELVAV
jgi:S-adenosyl-L-methionine hydrolase (adenosine-forming)